MSSAAEGTGGEPASGRLALGQWEPGWCLRMFEVSPVALLITDRSGTIAWANPQAAKLYGHITAELVGRHISLIVPPERHAQLTEMLDRAARGERIEPHESAGMTAGGRTLTIEAAYSPIPDVHGTVVAVAVMLRDLTEQKRTEAELARLYDEQRRVAVTLQHSLLGTPSEVPDMVLASRYLPGNSLGAEIGGDWFDAVPLGAGRTALVIGDVMGRGLESAAVMGQLRTAARALLKTGMQPFRMMHVLDGLVRETPDLMVTCCCVLIEPGGELAVCSAGHLPVLHVGPDAAVARLSEHQGVPLGVGGVPHEQTQHLVRPGSVLVLYTDGLVETRRSDLETRIETLIAEVRATAVRGLSLEETADGLLSRMLPEEAPEDDMTLLLAEVPPPPLATASTILSSGVGAVPAGRRFLSSTLKLWGCESVDDTARLLVSELLSNAVRHGVGPLGLRLRRTARELILEVTDHSMRLPQPKLAGPDDESGRGLRLVDALAAGWGTTPDDDGKTVWCTLTL